MDEWERMPAICLFSHWLVLKTVPWKCERNSSQKPCITGSSQRPRSWHQGVVHCHIFPNTKPSSSTSYFLRLFILAISFILGDHLNNPTKRHPINVCNRGMIFSAYLFICCPRLEILIYLPFKTCFFLCLGSMRKLKRRYNKPNCLLFLSQLQKQSAKRLIHSSYLYPISSIIKKYNNISWCSVSV